jgi:phosphoglycolate phosphatase-like HAD superfamily hydrolase
MPSAVIFDCDGVLFDSWRANVAYYNAIRARMGLDPMDAEWERRAHFLAAPQVFQEMFGADPMLLQRARDVAHVVSYEPFFDMMVPAPGLHDVLATLRRHHRLAMATNRGSTVQEIVRRFDLGRWLDTAVGVHDVPRPKPAPDMLELALVRLGVTPDAAVYVGDSASDLHAASAAGMHFVGIGGQTGGARTVRALDEVPVAVRALLPAAG